MNDFPGMGHNQPPEALAIVRAATLVETCNKWLAERPEIATNEQAGLAQAFIVQLRECADDLDAALKAERKPHDEAIAEIRVRFRKPLETVGIALDKMKGLATAWLDRQKERAQAEADERQRLADEAAAAAERARADADKPGASVEAELAARDLAAQADEAAAVAGRPVERVAIRGDFAARAMSLRSNWKAKVVDEKLALKHYGKAPEVQKAALEAATRLATKLARVTKNESAAPPGFVFYNDEKAA